MGLAMNLYPFDCSTFAVGNTCWIDTSCRTRVEEFQGRVGLRELRENVLAMSEDPGCDPAFHGLADFSAAKLELSANDVIRLGLLMRQKAHQTSGWLTYVTDDTSTRSLVRMLGYWSRTTDRQRVFRSREEAEAWLKRNRFQQPPRFIEEDAVGLKKAC